MADHDEKWFQVSVKGMFFNSEGELMMIQEDVGKWELPGGRIEKGEDMAECLRRECREELGLEVEILDKQPTYVYSTIDNIGEARLMVFYRVSFNNLDFKPNDECVAIEFFPKSQISKLDIYPQLRKLLELI